MLQPTGPHGREPQRKVKGSYRTRFNPRALVGANSTQERIIFVSLVSIYAPTWARTGDVPALSGSILVSIHAPVRAQTRHRQRCGLLLRVSIHAPTWARTTAGCNPYRCRCSFNPRARETRMLFLLNFDSVCPFQSIRGSQTRTIGLRLRQFPVPVSVHTRMRKCVRPSVSSTSQSFQLTLLHRRENLSLPRVVRLLSGVSIHAPAWARASAGLRSKQTLCVSIHAPSSARTSDSLRVATCTAVSIHAPLWART